MTSQPFPYDVAVSFLAQDEALALQLADFFEGRLRIFVYSREQEQIAGTDGEATFNDVFGNQARVVVVLYRDGWGQSRWTRIEETAIRNRGHEHGYDFCLFIPLDAKQTVPLWFPKNRVWIGLTRFGIESAAAVIGARVQEQGGEPSQETLEDRAARTARAVGFAKRREQYMESMQGAQAANAAATFLLDAIMNSLPTLQAAAPDLRISVRDPRQYRRIEPGLHLIADCNGPSLLLNWRPGMYSNRLAGAVLEASIWEHGPVMPGQQTFRGLVEGEEPSPIATLNFGPDLDPSGDAVWATRGTRDQRTFSSKVAADYILNWWLRTIEKQTRNQ